METGEGNQIPVTVSCIIVNEQKIDEVMEIRYKNRTFSGNVDRIALVNYDEAHPVDENNNLGINDVFNKDHSNHEDPSDMHWGLDQINMGYTIESRKYLEGKQHWLTV